MHPHFSTGQPCDCGFTKHLKLAKTAGKLKDFLMNPKSRPDLQTDEGKRFLSCLEGLHDERTDDIMPWLAREWKKGRIHQSGDGRLGHLYWKMDPMQPGLNIWEGNDVQYHDDPGAGWIKQTLRGSKLREIADWYHDRNHPLRRSKDLMQMQLPDVLQTTDDYHDDLEARRKDEAAKGGKVVHQYPDGWTLRQLHTPEELKSEGETMGHCVGSYADQVRRGDSLIYSLRDPEHHPHVTTEIEPTNNADGPIDWDRVRDSHPVLRHAPPGYLDRMREVEGLADKAIGDLQGGWHDTHRDYGVADDEYNMLAELASGYSMPPRPDRGSVIQLQGRGNGEIKPEYKDRMKQWFESFPPENRPTSVNDSDITHIGELTDDHSYQDYDPYHGNYDPVEYGLADSRGVSYPEVLPTMLRDHGYNYGDGRQYDPDDGRALYEAARQRGEIPQLAKAVEDFGQEQQGQFDEWRDMNYGLTVPYPSEADEDSPEMKAYYDNEAEWAKDHAGMEATNHMYGLIGPHWDGKGYGNKPQTFSKVATNHGYRHYNGYTGQPCTCPWNSKQRYHADRSGRERYGFVVEAGEHLNKALKATDKKLQTDEGKKFLEALGGIIHERPDADPLVPWLIQRWKRKGGENDIGLNPEQDGTLGYKPYPGSRYVPLSYVLPAWSEWYNARQHPLRRGVNVMDPTFDVQAMVDVSRRHQEDLEEKRRIARLREYADQYGTPVYHFDNGHHIRELRGSDAQFESDALGHCFGTDERYGNALDNGRIQGYSLRDKDAIPHATFHINSDGSLAHVQGKSGGLREDYRQMVDEFLQSQGIHPEEVGENTEDLEDEPWWDDEYTVEGPNDLKEMKDYANNGPYEYAPDDYNSACADASDRGMEEPALNIGPANWDSIVYDAEHGSHSENLSTIQEYLNHYAPPQDAAGLREALRDSRKDHETEFGQFDPGNLVNHPDPFERQKLIQEAERQHYQEIGEDSRVRMLNHLGPHFLGDEWENIGTNHPSDLHPGQTDLFQENTCRNCGGDVATGHQDWCGNETNPYHPNNTFPYGYPQYQNPAWSNPDVLQPGAPPVPIGLTYSKIASNSAPTYYRWVFSPANGEVTLGHNWESHPADVKYHSELAGDVNEPDLQHGYAYRIGGGWRLTDWESRPLTDPFMIAQVVRALRSREGTRKPPAANPDDWEAADQDFQQFHYGLPA